MPATSRLVENDDVLPTGHAVSEGDFILLSSWAMGRNGRIWENPNDFNPDRFTDENLRAQAERLARWGGRCTFETRF